MLPSPQNKVNFAILPSLIYNTFDKWSPKDLACKLHSLRNNCETINLSQYSDTCKEFFLASKMSFPCPIILPRHSVFTSYPFSLHMRGCKIIHILDRPQHLKVVFKFGFHKIVWQQPFFFLLSQVSDVVPYSNTIYSNCPHYYSND